MNTFDKKMSAIHNSNYYLLKLFEIFWDSFYCHV